jgi:hypothetical protein
MKIAIYGDNTLSLQVEPLCNLLNRICGFLKFSPGKTPLHLNTRFISSLTTFKSLPPELKSEAKGFELAIIGTAIPYENNYFYESAGNIVIVSFAGWNLLTDAPITNGLVYFLASMLCQQFGIGDSHENNIGCVNDFLWDKKGVDTAMRAAYLCRDCRGSKENDAQRDIEAMLDLVARASRARTDVLATAAPASQPGTSSPDVFLCHNTTDKPQVRDINAALKEAGLRTWLDEEQIRPGQLWQVELENQIEKVTAACVFVGKEGMGPWQNAEIRAFLSQFVSRGCVVIPVLLPDAPAIPALPIFLREIMWVDLRQNYPQQLARLIGALNQTGSSRRQN